MGLSRPPLYRSCTFSIQLCKACHANDSKIFADVLLVPPSKERVYDVQHLPQKMPRHNGRVENIAMLRQDRDCAARCT